jgi:hypothetical protein
MAARRLPPVFRRGLVIGALGLALAWRLPPLEQILACVPLLSLGARQYWAVVFVLFASAAAGPALYDATPIGSPRWARAFLFAGLLLLAAGLLPSLPPARAPLFAAGERAVESLRGRGKLPHSAETYRARLDQYLRDGRWTAFHRLAFPGACWALAGWALADAARRRRFLVAAILGEIAAFGVGYLPAVGFHGLSEPAPAIRDVKRLDPDGRSMIASSGGAYPANLATLDGVHDIVSFDVLESSRRIERLKPCGFDEASTAFRQDSSAPCLAGLGVRFFLSREPPAGTVRVGGGAPPAVGVYEIPGARAIPPPSNAPPRGLAAGALVSAAALVGAAFLTAGGRR